MGRQGQSSGRKYITVQYTRTRLHGSSRERARDGRMLRDRNRATLMLSHVKTVPVTPPTMPVGQSRGCYTYNVPKRCSWDMGAKGCGPQHCAVGSMRNRTACFTTDTGIAVDLCFVLGPYFHSCDFLCCTRAPKNRLKKMSPGEKSKMMGKPLDTEVRRSCRRSKLSLPRFTNKVDYRGGGLIPLCTRLGRISTEVNFPGISFSKATVQTPKK